MADNTERSIYIIELRDRFTKSMSSMNNATTRFNNSVDKVHGKVNTVSDSFGRMGIVAKAAILGAVYGMGRLATSAVTVAAKFETVEKAFNVMLGDKGLGGKMMDWAKEFSRTTIITFDQTVTSIRKLLAYGIGEENIRPLTKTLSAISAGVGTDRLPYLTLALGQVYSRGRLMGTELRQFREHGVDIVTEIAKGLGKGTKEVEEMVTKGMISFDMVAKAMIDMTKEGGRFAGMLEEMAKTTTGLWNILKSSWSIAMASIGDEMLPVLNKLLAAVTPAVEKLSRVDWQYLGNEFMRFAETMGRLKDVFTTKSIFRIIYEELVVFTFNMSAIGDKLTTELDIAKNSFTRAGNFISEFFSAMGDFITAGNDADYKKAQQRIANSFGALGGQSDYAQQQRDALALRTWKNQTDMARQLRANLKPAGLLEDGEYVPIGNAGIETGDDGAKTKRTNRMVGTGARDIIINIGNLIENVTNNNNQFDKNVEAMNEAVRRALLTVVNDVSLMAE